MGDNDMIGIVAMRVLLGAALIITFPTPAAAQADEPTIEGTEWFLTAYAADGELTDVPWYMAPTLSLDAGRGRGLAACAELLAIYVLDGATITFTWAEWHDEVGCSDDWTRVQDAYLEAFPTTASWDIEAGLAGERILRFYDEAGDVILAFQASSPTPSPAELRSLADQLISQQRQIDSLWDALARLRGEVRRSTGGTHRQLQTPAEARATDLRAVAEGNGWTLAETRTHFRATRELRRVSRQVREEQRDIWIGGALSETPEGAPSLFIKGPAPEWVREIVADAAVPIVIVDEQPYSFDELELRKDRVSQALVAMGLPSAGAGVSISGGGRTPASVLWAPGLPTDATAILESLPEDLRSSVDLTILGLPPGHGDEALSDDLASTQSGASASPR
jgi:hypothetical protein